MLASIFSKTKPINYIILISLTVLTYVIYLATDFSVSDWTPYDILKKAGVLALLLFMVFLSQFIVSRNRLVADNAYVPLLFVTFTLFFPTVFLETKVVVANFFIMLALRRIVSLHSYKNLQEKIFDAALWILVASLFHFWSIVFLLILFSSLILFGAKELRNWIIPGIALLAVSIFLAIYLMLIEMPLQEWLSSKITYSFNFMYFDNVYQNIALAVFASIAILFFVVEAMRLPSKAFNIQSTYKQIVFSFLLGLLIYVLSADKNNGVLLFTFFPLSALGANYVSSLPQRWQRETVISVLFFMGIFFYTMQLMY